MIACNTYLICFSFTYQQQQQQDQNNQLQIEVFEPEQHNEYRYSYHQHQSPIWNQKEPDWSYNNINNHNVEPAYQDPLTLVSPIQSGHDHIARTVTSPLYLRSTSDISRPVGYNVDEISQRDAKSIRHLSSAQDKELLQAKRAMAIARSQLSRISSNRISTQTFLQGEKSFVGNLNINSRR